MGAQTTIRSKDRKIAFQVTTESYISGTYMIITMLDPKTLTRTPGYRQFGSKKHEDTVHKGFREDAAKAGDIVIKDSSTPMTIIEEQCKRFWEENEAYA